MSEKGKLEIRITALAASDVQKMMKSIESVRKEFPEADIYVEWMV